MPEHEPPILGEFDLIGWIRGRERSAKPTAALGIGDDCAIVDLRSARTLATVDMLLDGRHFRLDVDGPEAVGRKAMGVNLSDVAAMAGVPAFAVVSVALPRDRAVETAQGLHRGMRAMADRFGVQLVGGDTNVWDGPLVVSVTVLGAESERGARLRSGAKAGDVVLVTGPLGGSLFHGRHLRPEPRVAEALAIVETADVHAMIDLSDGLSSDLGHILEESGGLGAVLDADAIPIHPDAKDHARHDGVPALEHALHDGEDFELCLTAPPAAARALLDAADGRFHVQAIGAVDEGPGLRLRTDDGRIIPLEARGFDHLKPRPHS